ncbi:MAG: hypothetical protein R6X20_06610 [Phycisphaerae bacterium]
MTRGNRNLLIGWAASSLSPWLLTSLAFIVSVLVDVDLWPADPGLSLLVLDVLGLAGGVCCAFAMRLPPWTRALIAFGTLPLLAIGHFMTLLMVMQFGDFSGIQ